MKKILIIVLLGLLIYGFSLSNGFVWDDEEMFLNTGSISNTVYFRPVITAIYSTIHTVFGQSPFIFHFFQIIFHIVTAISIYYLFKYFFKEKISFILALIFLIHPSNVEAVSFISAIQEVMFTLTGIIGLYLLISSENPSIIKTISTTLLLFISLLMKETAIVFFVLVFCYLFLFKKSNQKLLINYSIFAVIFLMIYFLFRFSEGNLYVQGQGLFPIMRVSLVTRLINIPMIILYYFEKFFYPINLAIAQHWVVKSTEFYNFFLPLGIEIILLITAVLYILKKKDKAFTFFFFWFLIGLLPHLQIVPLNMTVAERWLYFPMIGLLGMIGSIINKSNIKNLRSKINLITLVIIIVVLSFRSFIRTLDWHDGLALYSRDIKNNSSFDLQNNIGVELFRVGKYDQAKKYFEISVKIAPYWWVNWNNLGAIYEHEKNYEKAAKYYQKAIDNGQYYLAYENLGNILFFHEKNNKKTEEFFKKALNLFPKNKKLLILFSAFNREKIAPGRSNINELIENK